MVDFAHRMATLAMVDEGIETAMENVGWRFSWLDERSFEKAEVIAKRIKVKLVKENENF